MKKLLQALISLFKTGGKTKTGTVIIKDLLYTNQLKTIVNWKSSNIYLHNSWSVTPKPQQIEYLKQLKQRKLTIPQLESILQAEAISKSSAAIKFTVKHGIKFAENELLEINRVAERIADTINNKQNLIKYPEGIVMTLQTLFTVRAPGTWDLPIIPTAPKGTRKQIFPDIHAKFSDTPSRQARIKVHVVPYAYAKTIYPKITRTTRGWDPGTYGSTHFYLVWEHFTVDQLKTSSGQYQTIRNVMTHEIAHIKDPATVASPKLNAAYSTTAPYVGDAKIALSKKAAPNYMKNYYYHQFEVAANLAPALAQITSNTRIILRSAGKKRTLAALDQLLNWAASGTNTSFKSWKMMPGNFAPKLKLDTTATYILTGASFNLPTQSVELFFHQFKIENPTEHRKVLNKLARQLQSLKQQVIDTAYLTPESVIKLKTLV